MRLFQLIAKVCLLAGKAAEPEEAFMQLARQQRKVLLIVDGFFLAVQEPFDVIDTCIATAQKKLEKCDMRVKWMNQTTLTPFIY